MANSLTLGCDCLGAIHYFDAVVPDLFGERAHDRERDLPARGGCRPLVEAFRRAQRPDRGAPRAQPGDLVDLDHRQLRIRLLLVSAPGRAHRVRDEGDRHHQYRRLPSRSAGQVWRPRSRRGSSATSISTCSARAWTWRSTDRTTPWSNATRSRRRLGRKIRMATLSMSRSGCCRPNRRRSATSTFRQDALLEDHQSGAAELGRHGRRATSWRRARRCGRSLIPTARRGGAARFIQHQLWVTPFDPEERFPAGEFVNQSTGDDGLADLDAPRTGRWRTRTSCYGTASACTICRGRRIIRSSPASSCGFKLHAAGFFDQNPVIDLPRLKNEASCCACAAE